MNEEQREVVRRSPTWELILGGLVAQHYNDPRLKEIAKACRQELWERRHLIRPERLQG
jgi:hypothetical protein